MLQVFLQALKNSISKMNGPNLEIFCTLGFLGYETKCDASDATDARGGKLKICHKTSFIEILPQ